jgi:hypothetical protein
MGITEGIMVSGELEAAEAPVLILAVIHTEAREGGMAAAAVPAFKRRLDT